MSKKDVTKTQDNFPTDMPDYLKQGSGRGSEDVGSEDLTIPRISIIQDLSPHHKKNKPEYIEGAEVGMAFNTVSQTLYGSELFIVPVYYRKEFVLWKDQSKGGGFHGAFGSMAEGEEARAQVEDGNPNDYEVVDTAQQFVLVVDEKGAVVEEAVISMAKSQMKPNRALNTQIRMAGGDRFSRVYKLSVIEAQNGAGQEYMNWDIKPMGYVTKETYETAEVMYDSVKGGSRDVNRNSESAGGNDTAEVPENEFDA